MGKFKTLGDRCKFYEQEFAPRKLFDSLPVICRLDAKGFHNFTKGLQRPSDPGLKQLMKNTTKFLVEMTNARVGYTQSDEITLLMYNDSQDTQGFFDYKRDKINSVLAASASVFFNKGLVEYLPSKIGQSPVFDSRCFNVPSQKEAVAAVLWRVRDCVKNSITMAASCYYSHNELHLKNSAQKQELLWQKGINWSAYAMDFKEGSFFQRVKRIGTFSAEELEALPEKHKARSDPSLTFERSSVESIDMPPFEKITNKVDVLFYGAKPLLPTAIQK